MSTHVFPEHKGARLIPDPRFLWKTVAAVHGLRQDAPLNIASSAKR